MSREISENDDIIDSRDIIKRIEELESELDDAREKLSDAVESAQESLDAADEEEKAGCEDDLKVAQAELQTFDDGAGSGYSEEQAELKSLKDLADQGEGCADWSCGETLINESYFQDYAQQLAEDIGAMKDSDSWPYTCIDWEQAANELLQDYTSLDFNGTTFYIRS
jgi:hypothetical protein